MEGCAEVSGCGSGSTTGTVGVSADWDTTGSSGVWVASTGDSTAALTRGISGVAGVEVEAKLGNCGVVA